MVESEKSLIFKPLTPDFWPDLESLFGPGGAYAGCWCMWWRETRADFDRYRGEGNRQLMKDIVDSGQVPGILAYIDNEPIGWCSVAPRDDYGSINRSRVLKPIDDKKVWSIVCFYVEKQHRGQGLNLRLIKAAVDYAEEMGGKIVEAYPTIPRGRKLAPVSSFMGIPDVFERAGFILVAQPSEARAIMRYIIED
jgi:predicted GNAT family acetyltransferase